MSQEEQFRQLKMAWPAGLPAGRSRARYRQNLAPLSTRVGRGEFITPPWRPKSQIPASRFWVASYDQLMMDEKSRVHGIYVDRATSKSEAKTTQPVAPEEAGNGGLPSYDEAVDSDSGAAHGEAGLPSYDEAVSSKV